MAAADAKLILVERASSAGLVGLAELAGHMAGLRELPRRALSTPMAANATPPIAAFVELWGPLTALRAVFERWPGPASAWLVDERRPTDAPRTWPSGAPSPGVRLVGSVHRRPDLDRAAFAGHWSGPHARVAQSFTIPVWRYSQNVVVEAWSGDEGEDGFAVLHFRTAEELADRWARYPEDARRGAEDAARFMDTARGWSVVMTETLWEEGRVER